MLRRTRFIAFVGALLASASFQSAAQLATDCADIRDRNPAAGDGDYVISTGGKTFQVY